MILDEIGDILSSASVGTPGTDLFLGTLPDLPDTCVAVFLTGGLAPVHAMAAGPGSAIAEQPRIAVWARARRADDAYKKAQDAWFALDQVGSKTVRGVTTLQIEALQSPFLLQRDASDREVYACNYQLIRIPSTSS